MAHIAQEIRFDLDRHEAVAIDEAAGYLLRCESGSLWVTVGKLADERILQAGDSLEIAGNGEVVISALKPATASIALRQSVPSLVAAARLVLRSLRRWDFPPLATFPAQLIR